LPSHLALLAPQAWQLYWVLGALALVLTGAL
jgi:hypothetical protein